MELRKLIGDFLKKISEMSSTDEIINYTLNTKIQVAGSLNKKGHDFDVNLGNISNKFRVFTSDSDINNCHFLSDLEKVGRVLQGRWLTDFGNQEYSNELQKRVRRIMKNIKHL